MGLLTLPASGIVYVDTPPMIYTVERHRSYWPVMQTVWRDLQAQGIGVLSSELTLLEVLVKPEKDENQALGTAYERFLFRPGMRLVPISQSILRSAARLRAEAGIKTPDAIHAATALA